MLAPTPLRSSHFTSEQVGGGFNVQHVYIGAPLFLNCADSSKATSRVQVITHQAWREKWWLCATTQGCCSLGYGPGSAVNSAMATVLQHDPFVVTVSMIIIECLPSTLCLLCISVVSPGQRERDGGGVTASDVSMCGFIWEV